MPTRFHAIALVLAVFAACAARADAPDFDAAARITRELLAQLVAADTSNPPGNEARAVAIGVKKLIRRFD